MGDQSSTCGISNVSPSGDIAAYDREAANAGMTNLTTLVSPITGSAQQPGDCEGTVKDNQNNVIAVPKIFPCRWCMFDPSAVCFDRQCRFHASFLMDQKVGPHTDQKGQGLKGSKLIRRTWRRVFEVHKHPVGDILLLFATRVDRHGEPSEVTTPSLSENLTAQSSSLVKTPFSSSNSG